MAACREFTKRYLKDSQTIRNKNSSQVWRKPGTNHHLTITIPTVWHGDGRETERLDWVEGRMNAILYRDILDDNLERSRPLDWGKRSSSNSTLTLSTQRPSCRLLPSCGRSQLLSLKTAVSYFSLIRECSSPCPVNLDWT